MIQYDFIYIGGGQKFVIITFFLKKSLMLTKVHLLYNIQ